MKKIMIIFCLMLLTISILGCANSNGTNTENKTQTKSGSNNSYLTKIHEQYFIGSKKLFHVYLEESNKIQDKKLSDNASMALEKKFINEKVFPEINKSIVEIHKEVIKNVEEQKRLESVSGKDKEKRKLESEMLILGLLEGFVRAQKIYYDTTIMAYDSSGSFPHEVIDMSMFAMVQSEYNYKKAYYKLVENKDYEILTKQRFEALEKGDSFEIVSTKLGMPGKLEGTQWQGSLAIQTYVWKENSGANIRIKFSENRMYSAEQSGLK